MIILNQDYILLQSVARIEFIIMPNHMHAIIRISRTGELHSPENEMELHSPYNISESQNHRDVCNTKNRRDVCNTSLQRSASQTIGAIIRGYKSSVTKQLNSFNIGVAIWQRNYYEHIIRNEISYQNISNYIINNPQKWAKDKFYKK